MQANNADTKETSRTEAFSDGVFAIAITLLILEIAVPHDLEPGQLLRALGNLWSSYLAFLISFATIGIMWINHHRLFTIIRRSDHGLLIFNTLLLLGVTFVPFPTAVLAEFIDKPDFFNKQIAAAFYSGTFFVIALFFNALWWYAAYWRRLLGYDEHARAARSITFRYIFAPTIYAAAFALAFLSPEASVALNLALAVSFALPYNPPREQRASTIAPIDQPSNPSP